MATEGVNANQVIERDGGTSHQLNQNAMIVDIKQRARTPSTANNARWSSRSRSGQVHREEKERIRSNGNVIRRVKSEAMDDTHVRIKGGGKLRYEFEEFVHQKEDKVIERIDLVKFMKRQDDTSQRRQIDHVVTDMKE